MTISDACWRSKGHLKQKTSSHIGVSWVVPPVLSPDLPLYEKQKCRYVLWPTIVELLEMQPSQQQPIAHGSRSLMMMKDLILIKHSYRNLHYHCEKDGWLKYRLNILPLSRGWTKVGPNKGSFKHRRNQGRANGGHAATTTNPCKFFLKTLFFSGKFPGSAPGF